MESNFYFFRALTRIMINVCLHNGIEFVVVRVILPAPVHCGGINHHHHDGGDDPPAPAAAGVEQRRSIIISFHENRANS